MWSLMLMGNAVRRPGADALVNLSRRRVWFADPPPPADDKKDDAKKPEDKGDENPIKGLDALPEDVRDYIKSLRAEAKERREKLATLEKQQADAEAARKAAEAKEAEKKGEWEKLAKEREVEIERLKAFEAQATQLVESLKATNAARIAKLPEAVRSLAPTDYAPEKLAKWLDENESKLVKPPAPNLNPGRQSTGDGKKTAKQTIKRLSY